MSIKCPVPACGYNTNLAELAKVPERPLILETTRSHAGEDAWRDMDGFDEDEELARLRRAVLEVHGLCVKRPRHLPWVISPKVARSEENAKLRNLLQFIAESFSHLDESLTRLGPLPTTWQGSSSVTSLKGRITTAEEAQREKLGDERSDRSRFTETVAATPTNLKVLSVEEEERAPQPALTATFELGPGVKLTVTVPKAAYETLKSKLQA